MIKLLKALGKLKLSGFSINVLLDDDKYAVMFLVKKEKDEESPPVIIRGTEEELADYDFEAFFIEKMGKVVPAESGLKIEDDLFDQYSAEQQKPKSEKKKTRASTWKEDPAPVKPKKLSIGDLRQKVDELMTAKKYQDAIDLITEQDQTENKTMKNKLQLCKQWLKALNDLEGKTETTTETKTEPTTETAAEETADEDAGFGSDDDEPEDESGFGSEEEENGEEEAEEEPAVDPEAETSDDDDNF